jgi:xylulokinase
MEKTYIIAYDVGTTGCKACLYALSDSMEQIAQKTAAYDVHFVEGAGAEQNADDLWGSLREANLALLDESGLKPEDISAISVCSQMQAVVLVDHEGNALRPVMNYMDERAMKQFEVFNKGLIKMDGLNLLKNYASIRETGVTAASAKDPVFKYGWVRENEPEIFKKVYKYLDVGSYLILKCTGKYVVTEDVAYASLLFDPTHGHWSDKVCKAYNVEKEHLPDIIKSTDLVGTLTADAAAFLGLSERCKVIGGGGDVSMIALGAGCTTLGDTLIYIGTSGWVTTCVDKLKIDLPNSIASLVGAQTGLYNYFAEMELSGKVLEWARDHLMCDNVGVYTRTEDDASNLYDRFCKIAATAPPGSNGVVFTPYLLGNRCPFEDVYARASFFNLSLKNTKADMMRSVLEAIVFHMYWMLELIETKMPTNKRLRIIGGGAQSRTICRILADVSGRPVEQTEHPQNAGVLGAGILIATQMGAVSDLEQAKVLAKVNETFNPDPTKKALYAKNYEVYKKFHEDNKKSYRLLNRHD